jgi:FkbM family methyltransferase
VRSGYLRLRSRVLASAFRITRRVRRVPSLVRIGTVYGGHVVPAGLLGADAVCYSAGLGEDASFDLGLIERFGCDVYVFDFTPRAVRYAESVGHGQPKLHFYPWGLWNEDTTLEFFAPRDPSHVSYSAKNLQRTNQTIQAPVRTVASVANELGHDRIDLLKLDIEGAEIEVVASLLESGPRPTVVCLEFDQPDTIGRVHGCLRALRRSGYAVVSIERWNYTFAEASALATPA